jgi:SAM-dependent methyltransferase
MGKIAQSLADRAFRHPRGMLGRLGGHVMAATNRSLVHLALRALAARPGELILEVGCGPGTGLQALLDTGALPVGVDPSPQMLELARKRTAASQRTELFCAPAEWLPFVDGAFHAILAVDCLHLCAAPMRAMCEMRRVLRPGGRLVVAGTECDGCDPAAVMLAMEMARFCQVRLVEKSRRHFVIVGYKAEDSGHGAVRAALPS